MGMSSQEWWWHAFVRSSLSKRWTWFRQSCYCHPVDVWSDKLQCQPCYYLELCRDGAKKSDRIDCRRPSDCNWFIIEPNTKSWTKSVNGNLVEARRIWSTDGSFPAYYVYNQQYTAWCMIAIGCSTLHKLTRMPQKIRNRYWKGNGTDSAPSHLFLFRPPAPFVTKN